MRPVDEGRGRLPAEQGFSRELIRIQKVTANLGDDFVVCPDSVEEPSPVRRWPAQGCDLSALADQEVVGEVSDDEQLEAAQHGHGRHFVSAMEGFQADSGSHRGRPYSLCRA